NVVAQLLDDGNSKFIRSWKSNNDPGSGDYSFKMDVEGFPEIVIWHKDDTKICRSGPWNGKRFSGTPEMKGNMSLSQCREICKKNCSCAAYANMDITRGGSGCAYWAAELMDIREYADAEGGQDLYIRVSASDFALARSPTTENSKSGSSNDSQIVKVVASTELELPLLDFATLAKATNDFSDANKLGQGGFGCVYKGTLTEGEVVAIKRLSTVSDQGIEELKNEVRLIAKLQHRNLVRVLGCCIEVEEKLLIYEFMENKSLNTLLFEKEKSVKLNWNIRFQIICGITRGLLYLHQDSRFKIIHRDLKASNILLDKEMNPKISDFGMARIFGKDQTEAETKKVVGTYGYMSPEYAMDGSYSTKSDVFSFGVLVLEIVSGKRNRGSSYTSTQLSLLGHTWMLWREGNPLELVDESLGEKFSEDEVLRCIQIGLLCVQEQPDDRPSMSKVLLMLSSETIQLPQPKYPGFFIGKRDNETDFSSKQYDSMTINDVTVTTLDAR
nr:receptor-like serine/threonine-protein kinase SD1-8 [Tanacetum cinerariifolium]